MVTGVLPFSSASMMEMFTQILNEDLLPPRSLRADLPIEAERVILRALSKRPDERYLLASEVADFFTKSINAKYESSLLSSSEVLPKVRVPSGVGIINTSKRNVNEDNPPPLFHKLRNYNRLMLFIALLTLILSLIIAFLWARFNIPNFNYHP